MHREREIAILGGGPAGLAAGYHARRRGLPFAIYEARETVGGNAVTFEHEGFRFDSGAHRFHGDDPQVTAELRELLGDDLVLSVTPSRIYHRGKFIDFPLSPFDALLKLGPRTAATAAVAWLRAGLGRRDDDPSFRGFAVRRYGEAIARRFLLNYSEKLWGLPAEQLSRGVAGGRLAGLTLRSLFKEIFPGKTADDAGSFYYPLHGYGTIAEKLAAGCGEHHITRNAPVVRLVHDGTRIVAVEIAGVGTVEPSTVFSTIPLGKLVGKLDPRPAPQVLELARGLRSRNLLLVAFFLRRERVTLNGSVYFPDRAYPMTRVSEPNNRSPLLSPDGRTSLVVELPCDPDGERWALSDAEIVHLVQPHLEHIGWVTPKELIGTSVHRMQHAYPMLPLGVETDVETLLAYLARFENLRVSGRSGRHTYTHVHDELRAAQQMIDEETLARTSGWRRPARLQARPLPGPVGFHPANPP